MCFITAKRDMGKFFAQLLKGDARPLVDPFDDGSAVVIGQGLELHVLSVFPIRHIHITVGATVAR